MNAPPGLESFWYEGALCAEHHLMGCILPCLQVLIR